MNQAQFFSKVRLLFYKTNTQVKHYLPNSISILSRTTGLEPAAFGVTGQYSNQLSYVLYFFLLAVLSRIEEQV